MEFNLKKYKPRYTGASKDSLSLGVKILHIGIRVYELLGKPDKIDIFYDLEQKAIKIVNNETGRKVGLVDGKYPQLSCRLVSTGMPRGIYKYNSVEDIFIYEE